MANDQRLIAQLAAIRAAEPELKAFACVAGDAPAAAAAALADGPLAGRLIGIKDIFDTADLPTQYGTPIYAGHQSASDAAIVAVIRAAGGVIAGKTVTTEFAFLHPAATRNPVAPGCTPGGSSAGSAAAVAAGLIDFAVGSQTGGSTVRPASYCGIAGFKPTFGLLPTPGMKCFSWSLDTVGLFAETVEDVSEFAQVASGGRIPPPEQRPANHWRVGIPSNYPWGELSASASMAMERGVEALRAAGVQVVECEMPAWVGSAFVAHDAIQAWEAARSLKFEMAHHEAQLSPLLRDYLAACLRVTDGDYAAAQFAAQQARDGCRLWIDGIDVLLTPGAPDEPPEGYASTGASTFNRAFTLLGTPALNVPGAVGVNGRPMGVQVIAPPSEDAVCLGFGALMQDLLLRV
ncbi:amidase [Caenimonas koreensis DSM 17982]|uniref:Amidase n=1 Tax=Caenimonas koreensis DSM 17982 TaxID=1121255 RepID=A0A844B054_9BURK|nr:amidase [Caenimonas koreensis]MRD46493.1 amidase [Caenimonas koreensis DSM 17982]